MGCKACGTNCQCSATKCGDNCACSQQCQCACKNGPKDKCCSTKN
ncbi:GL23469 [Drosophila persimilis]|uniref:Metallothionein-4 n=2 Tax=pseudoobscura subgroup TaxID=32358 RepID=A0A6I8V2U9_DROPS|nr:metallothionein-4 [Drosophila persimilis]XP_002137521.1 metallothionein-4 [Drosophila pseudoobscura]XP_017142556.1 metallothionein-4 [Drosophila miranda]XP_022210726.1 metallothionein-4 [Drosophila obscura]XP_034130663.1 metallothionein-4 [Drosophila guanche]EDW24318.1 GL23469 [Drosophila persimilis]